MKTELSNRLMQFSKNLTLTCQSLTISTINRNAIEKCIESGTNAGADYIEASTTNTKKAFTFKINMCRSNLNEASYWLEILLETSKDKKAELDNLLKESKDLASIFNRISRKLKKGENEKKLEEKEVLEEK